MSALERVLERELERRGWRVCVPLDIGTIGTPVRYWKDPLGGEPVGLTAAIGRELRREAGNRVQQFSDRKKAQS